MLSLQTMYCWIALVCVSSLYKTTNSVPLVVCEDIDPNFPQFFFNGYDVSVVEPEESDPVVNHFAWDKSNLSALDYQLQFCAARCENGARVGYEINSCKSMLCTFCECTRPQCEIYGICCPDIDYPVFPEIWDTGDPFPKNTSVLTKKLVPKSNSTLKRPKLGCDSGRSISLADYLYIRSCDEGWNQTDINFELCREEFNIEMMTVVKFAQVIDMATRVVYKNKYCAACNRVEEVGSNINLCSWYVYMAYCTYKITHHSVFNIDIKVFIIRREDYANAIVFNFSN